jgi:hypothetical protein
MMSKQVLLQALVDGIRRLAIEQQQGLTPMNSRDFVYWLRGYLEVSKPTGITQEKLNIIGNHLQLAIQTEAEAKRLEDDMTRARMAKMLAEAGSNSDHIAYGMAHRGPAAGC